MRKPQIYFKFDPDRTREAIVYLASKSPSGVGVYMACKLLFLADKYHLVRYGRTITGDNYVAMDHGPVPSKSLDLLRDRLGVRVGKEELPLDSSLEVDRSFHHPRFMSSRNPDLDFLSKSDIEALDVTLDRHGAKEFSQLRAETHEMAAYCRAWEARGDKKASPMSFEDFFEEDSDAMAGVLEEAIEDSKLRKAFPAL